MRYLEKKIEEPTSMKEVNMLIKDRDELQKWSDDFNNKTKNHSKCGQKQLFLLCKTTKQVYSVRKSKLQRNVIYNKVPRNFNDNLFKTMYK